MARACILNPNGRGTLLVEYIKSREPITNIEFLGDRVCFEFSGTVTITFEDYLEVHLLRSSVLRFEESVRIERELFNRWVQSAVVRTLRGGEVVEYAPGARITVRSTERTELLCVRLTPEEKARVEEEAKRRGLSVSDYVRSKLLS